MAPKVHEPEHVAAPRETAAGDLHRPEASVVDLCLACVAGLFAVFWVRPFLSYISPGGMDEGIAFQGAVRILRGEVPYRDFFSFYTPGSYYLYAALFRVFGASMQVARTLLVAYAALFSFLTYMLARRAVSRLASVVAAVLLALICLPSRFQNLHSWDSTAMALLALYCAVWFLQTRAGPWAFFCGLFAGVTAMVEQTRGAGLIAGLAIAAVALYRIDPVGRSPRRLWPAVLGAALPVVAVTAYFAAHRALGPMLSGWFWPLHHYAAVNKLPYGYIFWSPDLAEVLKSSGLVVRLIFGIVVSAMLVMSLLPLLVLGLAATVGGKVLRGKLKPTLCSELVLLAGAVLLGNLLAVWASGRPEFTRMAYLAPLFFFALPLLLDQRLLNLPALSNLQPLLVVYLLVSFTVCSLVLRAGPMRATQVVMTRRGLLRTLPDTPEELLPYMQAHAPAGEKVLVYPDEPIYSFLSATLSPTKYDFLQVGMHSPAEFEVARRQLDENKSAVVVFDLTFRAIVPDVWPSTPAEVLATDPMGDFIFAHYRTCRVLQSRGRPFAYMVRKDLPCP